MSWAPPTKEELKKHGDTGFAPLTEEERKTYTGNGLLKGTLEALPLAGGVFGGALGTSLAGPFGTITGGTLGASLGKSLENLGEQYLLDEPKTTEQIYQELIAEAAGSLAGEALVPVAGKVISKGAKVIGSGIKKLSSELSGIPEKAYETYLKRPEQVKRLGDMSDATALQDAADDLRKEAAGAISSAQEAANDQIYWILKYKGNKPVNITPIVDEAKKVIKDLNPKIKDHAEQITEIQDMINQVTNLQIAPNIPFVRTKDVQSMKTVLQNASDYTADGVVKSKSSNADRAMKNMARSARILVEQVAPEIKSQNKTLSQLHNIRKNVNKNLLSPEKTAASVLAVGSGANQQSIKQMKKLEEITNYRYVPAAEELVAAQYFNDPKLLPVQTTGRAGLATGAAGAGAAASAASGNLYPAVTGAAIGLTGSPKAVKLGLDVIRGVNQASNFVMQKAPSTAEIGSQLIKRAIQLGIPPYLIDNEIKNYDGLTPTEKAKLRNQNSKQVK